MSITELSEIIKKQSQNRTHEERIKLLKNANIIDDSGFYSDEYFSKETVEKDRGNCIK